MIVHVHEWWQHLLGNLTPVLAYVKLWAGESNALLLMRGILLHDHIAVCNVLDAAWARSPDHMGMREHEGFEFVCDLLDGTIQQPGESRGAEQ